MLTKIDPKNSSRAFAYEFLESQILPTVTLIKKFDVTNIYRASKKGHKLNCLMNYVILKSAIGIPEFFLKIDGKTNDLYKSDKLSIMFVAKKKNGFLAYCSVEFNDNFFVFEKKYSESVKYCFEKNCDLFLPESAIVGTSTVPWTTLDGAVNGYGPNFTNPFIIIPKIEKKFFKYYVTISFQSHHLQMDGEQSCKFLENLQKNIKAFKLK